jgi:hypothetical protein
MLHETGDENGKVVSPSIIPTLCHTASSRNDHLCRYCRYQNTAIEVLWLVTAIASFYTYNIPSSEKL